MVCSREGFQKTYDLSDRVLPSSINTKMPSIEEFSEYLLQQQLRCHGLVSLKGISYLRKQSDLRPTIKTLVNEGIAQGQLEQLQLPSGEMFITKAGAFEQPLSRLSHRLLIVSPFDNCVIQRDRLNSLFNYNYQIECYVPEPKRQYGYFCLPILYQGEFIGRMDCKAHRKTGQLELKSLHWQEHRFDNDKLTAALAQSIAEFCQFQQCQSVRLSSSSAKNSNAGLNRALSKLGLTNTPL